MTTPRPAPLFVPLGEAALRVETLSSPALLASLKREPLAGVSEVIPALHSLTLLFDPQQVSAQALQAQVGERLALISAIDLKNVPTILPSLLVIPVVFDGPDLVWCAAHAGLTPDALIAALCDVTLEVAFLGFTPGFAFLSGLPAPLQMPRLDTPRPQIPAQSVALGGPWAGIYPSPTPGGWRLVGRTAFQPFDLTAALAGADPVRWQPGTPVRFEAVLDAAVLDGPEASGEYQ